MKKFFGVCWKFIAGAWSILAIIALPLGGWAAYAQLFSSPNISSQIVGQVNVFDLNQSLADLRILFHDSDIEEKNQNLRIYKVRFQNNGDKDITQNDFDQINNWGMRVENGSIIESRLADSNSTYIKNGLLPQTLSSSTISFNKIIFDKGSYFEIELLVLHNKDLSPSLFRTGKIAGIKENESPIEMYNKEEPFFGSVFYGTFYGNWKVESVRFLIYFVVSTILAFIMLVLIAAVHQVIVRNRQRPQPPQQPSA